MEAVSQKLEDSKREYVSKLEKMARLLDARAARIKVKGIYNISEFRLRFYDCNRKLISWSSSLGLKTISCCYSKYFVQLSGTATCE